MLQRIVDIAQGVDLGYDDVYTVKESSVVGNSQYNVMPIVEFKTKPKDTLAVVAPMLDFAATLIERKLKGGK